MIIGFTGSQDGMTSQQRDVVRRALASQRRTTVHHGDCVGADAEFHQLARRAHHLVHRHPPENSYKRAFCDYDWDEPPLPYLTRNQAIVDACSWLIATPSTAMEQVRSGTWATIRRAYERHVTRHDIVIWVIRPDGLLMAERSVTDLGVRTL